MGQLYLHPPEHAVVLSLDEKTSSRRWSVRSLVIAQHAGGPGVARAPSSGLFHYTPTTASWLNQVDRFFGILGKQSLSVTDFYSKAALREHLAAYMRAWNRNPTPFAWTKPASAIIRSHRQMLERISTAMH